MPESLLRIVRVGRMRVYGGYSDNRSQMAGVFSSSAQLTTHNNAYRVPGAVEAGVPDYLTGGTQCDGGGLPTDIAEDFYIEDVRVRVPIAASYLFVGVADCYYADNDDPNSDFAVRLIVLNENSPHLSSSNSCLGGSVAGALESQLVQLNNGHDARAVKWLPTVRHLDFHDPVVLLCDLQGITSSGGAVAVGPAPLSVLYDDLADDDTIFAFKEGFGIQLDGPLAIDIDGACDDPTECTYGSQHRPLPSPRPVIPAGTIVNSHFLHYDVTPSSENDANPLRKEGSVTFDTDVLGIIVRTAELNASDPILGHPGTQYPTENGRESELSNESEPYDRVALSADRRTVTIRARVADHADQIRIITQGYDPITQPYVNSTEYLDCADEVTLNNCDSAWYRFTFDFDPWCFDPDESDLSCNVRNVGLNGTANVTPQGIAYLNGNRVSGLMNNPGCDPDPMNGPDDPCYALQDSGHDLTDTEGRPILTAPTPDPFSTDDPEGGHHPDYFVVGENELIFGVAAGASYYQPTGLEFKAEVTYDLLGDCELDGDLDVQDAAEFSKAMTGPKDR